MLVHEKIKLLRESMNIDQKSLAVKLNINKSVMNRIELGTRPIRDDELIKFADFFNVSVDNLLGHSSQRIKSISFSERFKFLRLEKNMTQDDLVESFNKKYNTTFNKSTISQYENGKRKPEVDTLENWSDFFNVPVDYLLGYNSSFDLLSDTSIDEYNVRRIHMFGNQLKKLREEKSLTQNELAKIFNISPSAVGMYERNKRTPDFNLLIDFAKFFEVSTDYLLDYKNESFPEKSFADRLKILREENNLTQLELAQKFNITSQTISQYERGIRTPDFSLLDSIANYFGVSVDYLLGRTNIRNYEENTIAAHTDDRTQQLSEEGRKKLDDFIDYLIFEEMKKKND